MYLSNKNQQNAHFFLQCFNLIIASLTCSEHPSVHPQEDLYMQFYDIFSIRPYKQSGHTLPSTRHWWRGCACCWFLLHRYITMCSSKNVQFHCIL